MKVHQKDPWFLEDRIGEFEKHWMEVGPPKFEDFLPLPNEPDFLEILTELVRCDLELRWENGQQKNVDDYLKQFPQLRADPGKLREVLFEEYRLRAGTQRNDDFESIVEPWEYQDKYGIDVSEWPIWNAVNSKTIDETDGQPHSPPGVGKSFCGFKLIGVLGQGACGKVYLARQNDLANRLVSLKVTRQSTRESVMLAQLQHTNIVPVFSTHKELGLNAICMPFLGLSTLKDLLEIAFSSKDRDTENRSTQMLIATLARSRAETILETIPNETEKAGFEKMVSDESAQVRDPTARKRHWKEFSLEMAIRIAEGLAHAHSHNVIHGDLKPANILISDEGQPVLLDFHLSQSASDVSSAELVGGTIAYVSPEQLESLKTGQSLKQQSDVFSFGVILFEMFTGKHLWNSPWASSLEQTIELATQERSDETGLHRKLLESSLDHDLQAIIKKCVQPQVEERYQSIQHTLEDLQLHQRNLPLRHAKSFSVRERSRKWIRRHPRLASITSVLTISTLVIGLLAIALISRNQRLAVSNAMNDSRDFLSQIEQAKLNLSVITDDRQRIDRADQLAKNILEEFQSNSTEELVSNSRFSRLDGEYQQLERTRLAELFFWRAESAAKKVQRENNKSVLELELGNALRFNGIARRMLGTEIWKGLELQRSRLLNAIGDIDAGRLAMIAAENVSESNSDDMLLSTYLHQKDPGQTTDDAAKLVERDPLDYSTWILAGNIYANHDELEKAKAAFTVAISLLPDELSAHYSLGRAYLEGQENQLALNCFDRVIKIDQRHATAYLNRGLAQQALGQFEEAETSFSKAIDLGTEHTRAWYLRSNLRNRRGDQSGAAQDMKTFLITDPNDEISCLTRGAILISREPDDAIEDFNKALQFAPRSKTAYQNLAHVYSEVNNDIPSALEAMGKLIELDKSDPTPIATRGVLFARNNKREQALLDAQKALKLSQSADTKYRVAGIFAQLSKFEPHDSEMAIQLIGEAMFLDAKLVFAYLPNDPDIEPLKESNEFNELVKILTLLGADDFHSQIGRDKEK